MKRQAAALVTVLLAQGVVARDHATHVTDVDVATTRGEIALSNLDLLIARGGAGADIDELWLMRARFLADYAALDRGAAFADADAPDAPALLRRARARAAVHRFSAALADLATAERLGAAPVAVWRARVPIRIAQGAASEMIPALENDAAREPGFASASTLGAAYAGAGRYADADAQFQAALEALDTTSPFPYAWLCFVRGTMWAEQGGDPARGARHLRHALTYLPAFVAARLHLAEIDARRGASAEAIAGLTRVADSGDPEVLALLGRLHGVADPDRGRREIELARVRFEALLARQPLAFADHAAEFYLDAGGDPERARQLARANFVERPTRRARELLERAERARSPRPPTPAPS